MKKKILAGILSIALLALMAGCITGDTLYGWDEGIHSQQLKVDKCHTCSGYGYKICIVCRGLGTRSYINFGVGDMFNGNLEINFNCFYCKGDGKTQCLNCEGKGHTFHR